MNNNYVPSFVGDYTNDSLVTLRISRASDPFKLNNFRYINKTLKVTVGVSNPNENPDEWIEVQSAADAEKRAIEMLSQIEPDFELNFSSRRARDGLAAMSNRIDALCTRGTATHFICHPSRYETLKNMLRSNVQAQAVANEYCPENRVFAVFKPPLRTTTVDGFGNHVFDPKTNKHYLVLLQGKPTDVYWRHYASVAVVIDKDEDEECQE